MLIKKNWVAIGILNHKAGGTGCGLIGFGDKDHALRLELALQFTHIGK